MSDVRGDETNAGRFLQALIKARVRWLLIGRQALIHHGVPVQTMDYDVWVDPLPVNVGKLLRIAHEQGLEGPETALEVETRPMFSLNGAELKIDVFRVKKFTNLDGETVEFDAAYRRRVIARIEGDPLAPPLASIRDLKVLKRMRDEPSDREDLRYLELLEKQPARRSRS